MENYCEPYANKIKFLVFIFFASLFLALVIHDLSLESSENGYMYKILSRNRRIAKQKPGAKPYVPKDLRPKNQSLRDSEEQFQHDPKEYEDYAEYEVLQKSYWKHGQKKVRVVNEQSKTKEEDIDVIQVAPVDRSTNGSKDESLVGLALPIPELI